MFLAINDLLCGQLNIYKLNIIIVTPYITPTPTLKPKLASQLYSKGILNILTLNFMKSQDKLISLVHNWI